MNSTEISYRELFHLSNCGTDGSAPDCYRRNDGGPCDDLGITPVKRGVCLNPDHPNNLSCKRESFPPYRYS